MMINDVVWKKLESDSPTGEKITAQLALPESSKKLYVGFDAIKQRHLLIPLAESDKECSDSQSRGLSVTTRDLVVQGSEPTRYIDIICHDDSGHAIFNVIGGEIAEKLDKGMPQEVIMNVLSKWRYFWGQPPRELLSFEELIGLFAELWFLYHWILPKTNKVDAVNRWRGPFSSRHDFEWQGKSVEVKATTNTQSRLHMVHGIEQLSPPENGKLLFFSLRIREEQGSENTLPAIIALCQKKLKSSIDALSRFENTLAVAGYSPIHDVEYSKFRFRVVDEKLYVVTDNFPRLTIDSFEDGLPQGIGTIEYSINLDGFDNLCLAKAPEDITEL